MSFLLMLISIVIIIISILLIIFSRNTVISANEYDNKFNNSDSFSNVKESEHNDFEKILVNSTDTTFEVDESYIDNIKKTPINEQTIITKADVRDEYNNVIVERDNSAEEVRYIENIAEKINELKQLGLSNQDIARQLGKGIREIDTILKITYLKQVSRK